MPIFEYKCQKCGRVTEFLEKSGGKRKHVCEHCKSPDMKKLLSGFSIGQADNSSSCSWLMSDRYLFTLERKSYENCSYIYGENARFPG